MPDKILTRRGDGERVSMPADEVKEELLLGTQDAAQKGDIPELTPEDQDQMLLPQNADSWRSDGDAANDNPEPTKE